MTPLLPQSTIGILGGGQLGRMLAQAAATLGLRCHIYCPDADSPAFDVAHDYTIAAYNDMAALDHFASACDVITYEFENVPAATAERLASQRPVRPGPNALAVSQDRLIEKQFLEAAGLAIAPWRPVETRSDLDAARAAVGAAGLLKTRRLGYDGKGQVRLGDDDDSEAAFAAAGQGPYVFEQLVAFNREISVVAARGQDGAIATYDPAENIHRNQILHTSKVPASIAPTIAKAAHDVASQTLRALDYIGVIGIEMFMVGDGENTTLLVNEIAPRVHNTGHWTGDLCITSQFEMHIRAIAGWPLGNPLRHSDGIMTNLIGDDVNAWPAIAAMADARLTLYGKKQARPGRKMGHWTRIVPDHLN